MKIIKYTSIVAFALLTSCASVSVASDYDKAVDFSQYKTFAFHKNGVDKVEISDLDKKRILRAIDESLTAKGLSKSDQPELLINIFTKSRENVNVSTYNAGWGYGWHWNPYFHHNNTSVSRNVDGTLYIDIIDAKKKELIWQGEGNGHLPKNIEKKEAQIKTIVNKILEQYPPKK